jgi:mannose-1-phosphate guanylyltransferase
MVIGTWKAYWTVTNWWQSAESNAPTSPPLLTLNLLSMKAIILAAGLGTRLRPITDSIPKCLVPINGVPLLELWLRQCESAGIEAALLNTHYLAERVQDFVAARRGIPVTAAYEPDLLGSAGTIAANWSFVENDESFVVIYADNLTTFPLSELIAFHATHGQIASMALFRSPNPSACGVVEMDATGLVTGFWEKPENPRSNLVNAGLYVFRREVRAYLPDAVPADVGRALMPALVGRAKGLPIRKYFVDIGTLENYYAAQVAYAAACAAPTL